MSSSIPSWQILTAHAQPFRGARDLAFRLKVPLDSLLVWASSGGSGETARMRRLAWTFAARIGDKYQIRLARPIWSKCILWSFAKLTNFLNAHYGETVLQTSCLPFLKPVKSMSIFLSQANQVGGGNAEDLWRKLSELRHEKLCLRGLRHEKLCLRGLWSGLTQTGLRSHRSKVEAWNFGYRN